MEIWTKLVGRVRGANFASIYGRTKAMGYRNVTLPEGHPQLEKNVLLFLKNDHTCRFMGFGLTRQQQKRVDVIREKYKSLEDIEYGV